MQASGFKTVVLDNDMETIAVMRRFGFKGYFGDPTRPDLLHAAGIDTARVLVVGPWEGDWKGVSTALDTVRQMRLSGTEVLLIRLSQYPLTDEERKLAQVMASVQSQMTARVAPPKVEDVCLKLKSIRPLGDNLLMLDYCDLDAGGTPMVSGVGTHEPASSISWTMRGGATIKARCPLPTGAARSMTRVERFFGSLSRIRRSSG